MTRAEGCGTVWRLRMSVYVNGCCYVCTIITQKFCHIRDTFSTGGVVCTPIHPEVPI
jgi:hypothetical protein